ncbi:MAG TPA: polysaccharide pyruvyl transferase family protein [Methylomusa anaerophila]|uniref:Polysaccharide pyruvyl transferase n=1 Tax=Methylomusa anaerophila TaxID=1930071 RepID=A0A348AGB9_9FIRM|nr:polysaccharide pyruvyl transferase family protein [Methylomusa anaerophila]BBB90117.1 polysaccharide pyruvyl transferase [Methylomusa anaerophila]HML88159.1 polysaccharide pyruvyl transferase family protein [Methylomusa anaerophila]
MNISMITLHRVLNYGSFLQTYALQEYLEKLGHAVKVVDYKPNRFSNAQYFWSKNPKGKNNIMYALLYNTAVFPKKLIRKLIFDSYVAKYIKLTDMQYHTFADIKQHLPEADVYITGSDQVWNSNYNGEVDPAYFVDFAPQGKPRIAYAASFGRTELGMEEIQPINKLISKYNAISVRENSALKILDRLGRTDGVHVVDPTLLLNRDEWGKLIEKRKINDKYLLIYQLNNNNFMIETAKQIAKEKGLKIVKLALNRRKYAGIDFVFNNITPSDFLSLFAFADFVVTDSFHGSAFSINFNKELIVIPPEKYGTRLISLLETMGLPERVIYKNFDLRIIAEPIDYSLVNEKLQAERRKASDFLSSYIK